MRDDSNPEFTKQFYRALGVVCDDLFFSRYRRESSPATALAQSAGTSAVTAAGALLQALYGEASTEPQKHVLLEDLLETRVLPATDGQGLQFTPDRRAER